MKKIIFILLFCILFPVSVMAQGVGLQWDANDPADNVIGYIVFFTDDDPLGDANAVTEFNINVGNVTSINFSDIPVPQDGKTYWYVIRAYNVYDISGPSNIVSDTRPVNYTPPSDVLPTSGSGPTNPSGLINT